MSQFINLVGRLAGQTIGSEARVGGLVHLGSGPAREPTFFCFCIAELCLGLVVVAADPDPKQKSHPHC